MRGVVPVDQRRTGIEPVRGQEHARTVTETECEGRGPAAQRSVDQGGQRQRVGIARALYTQPSVLVLDEATSNLDQATENRIVETLASLRGGVTMIVVTHRTASVRHCDQIVYLENGRVRSAGTFDEIKAAVPEFDEPFPAKVAFGG